MERPIQRVIKHRFQKMFLEDKLYQALPNLNSWLATTFNRMNHYSRGNTQMNNKLITRRLV